VRFESYGEPVRVELIDMQGRQVQPIYSGTLPSGQQSLRWDTHQVPRGQYLVVVRTQAYQQAFRVRK
ncbi:MAG TPA: hypothetical protein DCE41_32530, partial [Cytophagales bacterium]|nr:hypothetical protein [Cytophagales bacterium]